MIMCKFNAARLIGKTVQEAELLLLNTGCKLCVITKQYEGQAWVAKGSLGVIVVNVKNEIIIEILKNSV